MWANDLNIYIADQEGGGGLANRCYSLRCLCKREFSPLFAGDFSRFYLSHFCIFSGFLSLTVLFLIYLYLLF